VEQDEEDEERRDGEQDRRRIARDAKPPRDRVQRFAPGGEHEEHDTGGKPEQRVALFQSASSDELEDDQDEKERRNDADERNSERSHRRAPWRRG
jgi:hypothetical protein